MNKKFVLITLAGSLLVSTGCTKSRWFTRKDYAESQDPFMETEAVASTSGSDKSGRATLDDATPSSAVADTRPLSGPKPIQRVGSVTDPANPGPPVSRAVYPESEAATATTKSTPPGVTRSYEGSELSGYLQKRRSEAEGRTAEVSSQASQAIGNQAAAAKSSSAALTNPARRSLAAETPPMTKLSAEAEGFNSFLEKGARTAESAASSARQTAATVQQTEDAAADFADFAAQKKAEWSTEATNAPATVRKTASNAAASVRGSAQTMVDDFVEQVNTPAASAGSEFEPDQFSGSDASFDGSSMQTEDEGESAQPLIRKPAAAESEFEANPFEEFEAPAPRVATPKTTKPVASKAPAPKPAAAKPAPEFSSGDEFEENPFENPFAEAPAKAAPKPAAKAAGNTAKAPASKNGAGSKAPAKQTSEPAVDDSFGFGTGWKPANLSTP